jgi:hypothetical protein
MARLASIEKAGYFPCPTTVVQALVLRHVRLHPWAVAPTYILDPCAGEGSAVHTFAQALASLPTSTMAAHYADMAELDATTFTVTKKTLATMMSIADYALRYFEQDFPTELLCWMGYIFIPIIKP